MDFGGNDKEVTIETAADVEGGRTCAPCVDNRHAECNIPDCDCLCARHSHVVN